MYGRCESNIIFGFEKKKLCRGKLLIRGNVMVSVQIAGTHTSGTRLRTVGEALHCTTWVTDMLNNNETIIEKK